MSKHEIMQRVLAVRDECGLASLGLSTNQAWQDDPKHLLFTLARYKFVAKMLEGTGDVLEVGCGDAFASRIVQQHVCSLTAVDCDEDLVADANARKALAWRLDCRVHDLLQGPVPGEFDAAYALDVLEHVEHNDEVRFLSNICASLRPHGTLILGTPSLQSQAYASPLSRLGHVNCKTGPALRTMLYEFFYNVFLFSMNDEVVHTGFSPMAQYLLVLCCEKREG